MSIQRKDTTTKKENQNEKGSNQISNKAQALQDTFRLFTVHFVFLFFMFKNLIFGLNCCS